MTFRFFRSSSSAFVSARPELPVRFYRAGLGKEPVLDWLRHLNREDRRTIGQDLMRVQVGWPIGMPLVRSFEGRSVEGALGAAQSEDCAADSLLS